MLIMATLPSTLILYLWAVLVWQWDVFEMAAPIQSPAQMRRAFRHTVSQRKSECPAEIHKQIVAVYGNDMNQQNVTKWCREFSEGSMTKTMMRCKEKSWRGSKGRRQTSMTRGYRSWFQDLINVWTMTATMLKNKVMYMQFIPSVAFVN